MDKITNKDMDDAVNQLLDENINPLRSECRDLLCFYVLYSHGGVSSWRITTTLHNLDNAEGLIAWITEQEREKPEHGDFFLKYWKRLGT